MKNKCCFIKILSPDDNIPCFQPRWPSPTSSLAWSWFPSLWCRWIYEFNRGNKKWWQIHIVLNGHDQKCIFGPTLVCCPTHCSSWDKVEGYTSPACRLQPSSSSSHADNYFALLSGTSGPVDLRLLLVSGSRDGGGVRNQCGLCTLVDILRLVHCLKLLQSLSLCLSIYTINRQLCHFLSLQNS